MKLRPWESSVRSRPEPIRLSEALSLRYPVAQLLPWLQLEHSVDDRERESFRTLCKHSSSLCTYGENLKAQCLFNWFLHCICTWFLKLIRDHDCQPEFSRGGGRLNSKWFTTTVLVCIRMSHSLTSALAPMNWVSVGLWVSIIGCDRFSILSICYFGLFSTHDVNSTSVCPGRLIPPLLFLLKSFPVLTQ